jgi:hypothetical protein
MNFPNAKAICLSLLLTLVAMPALGQAIKEDDLPREVMVSFRKNFPVIAVDAFRTTEGNYQLTFRADGADRIYLYAENGRLLVMRVITEEHKVPGEVREIGLVETDAKVLRVYRTRTAKTQYWELHMQYPDGEALLRLTVPEGQTSPSGQATKVPVEKGAPLPRI